MRAIAAAAGLGLAGMTAGCAGNEPVVNRINVSDAKYQTDLAQCRKSGGMGVFSSPAAECLRKKGYQVLMD